MDATGGCRASRCTAGSCGLLVGATSRPHRVTHPQRASFSPVPPAHLRLCRITGPGPVYTNDAGQALRPIKAGDELTISYIDLTQGEFKSVVNRRAALSDKYLFSCQCERCAVEETELVEIKLTIPAGAKPGMILQLDVDGVTKRVTVPEGVVAGQEIVVTV